ncbi:multi-sensor signal transduction histidine kinase [Actinoplanes teichomyceticus]|uniref:histidine kinase n=1 Tax=Actinoplanes teichomyceticus TaxID=1867 RepID=A0A561VLJ3_ACTTI|nr:multi-sensor signal transduction histidine kinase [Actinoplanes teichomyceticus]
MLYRADVTRTRRWTTQRYFAAVLTAMVVLILAATVVGAQALNRTSTASNRLNDRISPARTAVVQLDDALRNQDTALRGYLLSRAPQFLDLYRESVTAERAAATVLRDLLGGESQPLADLTAVEEAAARWRGTVADPAIRTRGGDVAAAFAPVRARLDTLDRRLATARQEGRAALEHTRRLRDIVFVGLVFALLLLIAAIAVLLRVAVVRPLTRLGAAVRRVSGGAFDHELSPHGPADVAELGRDVEAMRRRLVDALTVTRRARDELELREAELRRSNADLEQFAYVASHDLQEPLRKVASFCQMLQRRYGDALDDRARQYIAFAVDGATRMQRLINDLLTFSRIGRIYDDSTPVALDDILNRVQETLASGIAETGARIVRPPLPVVPGDVTLLTMLWQNLLGNAIKFRRPGTAPHVEITATATGAMWTFTVSDNGIGIDPEFADKIFVIFQRLHPRDRYGGTGIGLAICKKVVEHHGGAIELDGSYEKGARLVFTLPAGTPEPSAGTPEPSAGTPEPSAGTPEPV